jgi:2-amino-4-hydroxy-6-hydroxymethyldihydropteridine diphosphokinase
MYQVYVGIGSNIERNKHIRAAIKSLQYVFGPDCQLKKSPVYKTLAVGFDGDDFYNLVASFYTLQSPFDIEKQLKAIEHQNGRSRQPARSRQPVKSHQPVKSPQPMKSRQQINSLQKNKFSPRTLDIDLLLVDDQIINQQGINIPRDEIEKYAFVLAPLADLAPDLIHPVTGKTIISMWNKLIQEQQELKNALTQIEFNWE